MRFGIFLAPFHDVGQNPTLALQRDLDLLVHLDRLGFDEAWIGEHHSGGFELIASPEVFVATAAERTRHLRLGSGVNSLPYHQPLMLADRFVLLDHLTRGRVILGCGPGQLTSDALMMGIPPDTQRPRMEEALDAIVRLLHGETVTAHTDWFTLEDARLQLAPYLPRGLDMAVAASTGSACSRSGRRPRSASTSWPSTGTSWTSAPPSSASPPTGPGGGSSARCTSPIPRLRPAATSSSGSSRSPGTSVTSCLPARSATPTTSRASSTTATGPALR